MKYIHALTFLVLIITLITPLEARADEKVAYFAGGCFWCTESDFEKIDGIKQVISGFMGGTIVNPPYKLVASGKTRYRETVEVIYDSNQITYQNLLYAFWRMHDPSDGGGSFVDRGRQYSSAIYYTSANQKRLAKGAITALNKDRKFDVPIATSLEKASKFYPAEAYHQDYYKRNPLRYKYYRYRSGRDQFIAKNWDGDTTEYQVANDK